MANSLLSGWLPLALLVMVLPGCRGKAQTAPPRPHSVTLTWHASKSQVSGYHVYRTAIPSTTRTLLATTAADATQYTDATVQAGRTYEYVVTAFNSANRESVPSARIYATIPAP